MGHPTMQENDTAKLTPTSLICRIFCFKVQIVILSLIILCVLKNDCRHANVLFCLSSGFMQVKF